MPSGGSIWSSAFSRVLSSPPDGWKWETSRVEEASWGAAAEEDRAARAAIFDSASLSEIIEFEIPTSYCVGSVRLIGKLQNVGSKLWYLRK